MVEKRPNKELTVLLNNVNGSPQSGTMVLADFGKYTEVTVKLFNYLADTEEPLYIHEGSCPNPSFPKYQLKSVFNGYSISTISASLDEILSKKPLAAYVVKNSRNTREYVSCGEIK